MKKVDREEDWNDYEVYFSTNDLLWFDEKTEIEQFDKFSERDIRSRNPQLLDLYVDKPFDPTIIYLGDGSRGIFCRSSFVFVSIRQKLVR